MEEKELADYVGQPPFTSDRIYEVTPPGVVMGLAWSAQGGNSLYIEAASVERGEGKGSLKTTGAASALPMPSRARETSSNGSPRAPLIIAVDRWQASRRHEYCSF